MAGRRDEVLSISARLFAARGYHGVAIDEIGAEVGVSGPALYHYFPSKEAILAELLVGISQTLLDEGRRLVASAPAPAERLAGLVDWHVRFALEHPDLITVQARDLANLPPAVQQRVKSLQRRYVQLWVRAISDRTGAEPATAAAAAHAVFGMINSTPHSARLPAAGMARLLAAMSGAAIGAVAPGLGASG